MHFFAMGGYGCYVWPAYACVLGFLFIQWFIVWRRWKKSSLNNNE